MLNIVASGPTSVVGRPEVQPGTYTTTIYGLIKSQKWMEAIVILSQELENFPRSRAALSLLGFCHFHNQDFGAAAAMYERLVLVCPDVEQYKIYHAQSLYKAGMYPEAIRVASTVDSDDFALRMQKLRAAIKFYAEDLPGTKSHLAKCDPSDPDVVIMNACVLYKEGKYEQAITLFQQAITALGFRPDMLYNVALCYYRMRKWFPSLTHLADIIQRGITDHSELSIGANTEGLEVRSVGNSQLLRETALVEAFNLKAAIEYAMKNESNAREALSDMPPRTEEELDPVSLHNFALMHADTDPSGCFRKLRFLLGSGKFPPETFANLLLLYLKYGYFALAADVLADNPHLTKQYLSDDLYHYINARIISQSDPAEAYRMLDRLSQRHIEQLRKIMREIQEEKNSGDDANSAAKVEAMKGKLGRYDDALEAYIPVLMAQAEIYWNVDHYQKVEQIFRQSAEFASDDKTWQLNLGHVFFVQDGKFKECIRYYQPIYQSYVEKGLLNCSAMILANLCVSYVMTGGNLQAEDVMRQVEKEEDAAIEAAKERGQEKVPLHLCIINLVIGTLYCAKGNFEFGISRIMKSMEPHEKKIMPDTWFYAKRCFCALAETLAKHMILLKDSTMAEILAFFDAADLHGKAPARIVLDPMAQHRPVSTIQHEARVLKRIFLKLCE
eukprot:TRINITY_DN20981_c0_g1_i1.p1 TRINITY_DN20981_c0_g1~~TRINITY_DN20981_c0_g1_i1.p1  ORF type:complete len:670 (-),score=171.60 TRINITY_DN20981_c0_g1_i1:1921-3930(-)